MKMTMIMKITISLDRVIKLPDVIYYAGEC